MIYRGDNITVIPLHINKHRHRWMYFDHSDVDPRLKTIQGARTFCKGLMMYPPNSQKGLKAIVHRIKTQVQTRPGGPYRILNVIYYRNSKGRGE